MNTNQFDQMKEIAKNVLKYHKEYVKLKDNHEHVDDTLREYRYASFSNENEYNQIVETIKNLEGQLKNLRNEMEQYYGLFETSLNQAHDIGWENERTIAIEGLYVNPHDNYWEVVKRDHLYNESSYIDWWAFHHKISNEIKNVYEGWHATLPIKKLDEIR